LVQLTAKGRRLIDKALTAHIANEHELMAPMPPAERAALADLLRELSLVFETWRAERGIQTS
jgi:DNA-binding MarR family transcriptional regulator